MPYVFKKSDFLKSNNESVARDKITTGFFSTMTECDLANHPVSPSPHANQYLLDNLECKQHAYGGNQQHLALHGCQVHDNLDILVLLKGQVGGGGGGILRQSSITGGATE